MASRSMVAIVSVALLAGGCQSTRLDLPKGADAYAVMPPPSATSQGRSYVIGPLDVLSVSVFQEPELSAAEIAVDAAGGISLPLINEVQAEGRTSRQLADEIARLLGERYLVDPQVSVTVVSSVSQRVTVEGNVNEPGVYDIRGTSTLLESLARAKSTTRVAKLDEVVVFRTVNGERFGAVFDVEAIRAGRAPDPELLGGDTVVVGFDAVKGAFRDFLTTAPFFAIFTRF